MKLACECGYKDYIGDSVIKDYSERFKLQENKIRIAFESLYLAGFKKPEASKIFELAAKEYYRTQLSFDELILLLITLFSPTAVAKREDVIRREKLQTFY